jgi:O-antigen biosynthesis protein
MERSIFQRYMYHGRYAEDLILGIRLIRDGHRVGMLSSVKVIHSHTRPVGYHVRRVFVDVVFLSDVFPDFATPEATSVVGTFAAACLIRERLTPVKPSLHRSAAAALGDVIGSIRELALPHLVPDLTGRADFEFPPLGAWVESIARDESRVGSPMTAADKREAERMRSMCLDRLAHLRGYLEEAAPVLDESVARELTDAVEKTLAMALGTQLAFICLTAELDPNRATIPRVAELKPMLVAGI